MDNTLWSPELPPVMGCKYLLDLFFLIGPVMVGDMGSGPLTWEEINEFEEGVCLRLSPWEKLMLRRMSTNYHGEINAATKRDRKAPWDDDSVRSALAQSMKKALRKMANL